MSVESDGYAVVPGLLSAGEVRALQRVFTSLVPGSGRYPRGDDGVVWELSGASRGSECLWHLARDPRLGELGASALGCGRVRLLQDSLFYKPGRDGGSVAWHQDYAYLGFLEPPRVVTVRLALIDEDGSSGGLRVVPGSHRWGLVDRHPALGTERVRSLASSLSDERREALDSAVALSLQAGDASVHHCLAVHGSTPNRSPRPRRTFAVRLFDAACRFVAERVPPRARSLFPVDGRGRLDEATFPIVCESAGSTHGV